jgi:hypothetical protein
MRRQLFQVAVHCLRIPPARHNPNGGWQFVACLHCYAQHGVARGCGFLCRFARLLIRHCLIEAQSLRYRAKNLSGGATAYAPSIPLSLYASQLGGGTMGPGGAGRSWVVDRRRLTTPTEDRGPGGLGKKSASPRCGRGSVELR